MVPGSGPHNLQSGAAYPAPPLPSDESREARCSVRHPAAVRSRPLPLSSMTLLFFLAQSCATGPREPRPGAAGALEAGTSWNFSATAIAANVSQNQRREFTVPVSGELTILTPDSAAVVSTHGSCPGDTRLPVRIVHSGAVNRIRCRDLYLELTAGGPEPIGTVTVTVDVEYTTRGACSHWQVDPKTGQRTACLGYEENVQSRKARTAPARVLLSAVGK